MNNIKYCYECKHSMPLGGNVKCLHPNVVKTDAWALSGMGKIGADCFTERSSSILPRACGMAGKLWEPRNE